MTDFLLQAAGVVAACIIYARVEPILNLMAGHCCTPVRLAFWLLAVGAAALVVCIVWRAYVPPLAFLATLAGVALLLVSERRVRALLRIRTAIARNRRATS